MPRVDCRTTGTIEAAAVFPVTTLFRTRWSSIVEPCDITQRTAMCRPSTLQNAIRTNVDHRLRDRGRCREQRCFSSLRSNASRISRWIAVGAASLRSGVMRTGFFETKKSRRSALMGAVHSSPDVSNLDSTARRPIHRRIIRLVLHRLEQTWMHVVVDMPSPAENGVRTKSGMGRRYPRLSTSVERAIGASVRKICM